MVLTCRGAIDVLKPFAAMFAAPAHFCLTCFTLLSTTISIEKFLLFKAYMPRHNGTCATYYTEMRKFFIVKRVQPFKPKLYAIYTNLKAF